MRLHHALAVCLPLLAGCASSDDNRPVTVAVPGLPSPELALQRSLDRVHAFMASLNGRLETPVRAMRPVTTGDADPAAPLDVKPRDGTALAFAHTPAVHRTRGAAPVLYGKGGTAWIPFGDGYTVLRCARPEICIVHLQRGERLATENVQPDTPGWQVDIVRGTKGIHAAWAVAVSPKRDAAPAVVHVTTDRRRYAFGLVPDAPSMTSVAFTYAANDPTVQAEPPQAASSNGAGTDFAYAISGPDAAFKPLRVYQEGGRTYLQFSPEGIVARPRLTILAPHSDRPTIQRIVGNSYVVDGRVDQMVLTTGTGAHRIEIHIDHKKDHDNA